MEQKIVVVKKIAHHLVSLPEKIGWWIIGYYFIYIDSRL
jgi:hypothetical protein